MKKHLTLLFRDLVNVRRVFILPMSATNTSLAFNTGTDVQVLLDSSVGQPIAQIFYQSFGQKGTLAMWSIIIATQLVVTGSTLHIV